MFRKTKCNKKGNLTCSGKEREIKPIRRKTISYRRQEATHAWYSRRKAESIKKKKPDKIAEIFLELRDWDMACATTPG
jgi:hypothetical protein